MHSPARQHTHSQLCIKHKIHIENCSQHQPAMQIMYLYIWYDKMSPRGATKVMPKARPTLLLGTPSTRSTRPGSFTRPLVGEVFLLFSFSFSSLVIDLRKYLVLVHSSNLFNHYCTFLLKKIENGFFSKNS